MKKLVLLLTLLLSAQASASNFDVIYRFDSSVSDDYFTIQVDFDYVATDPVFFFGEEVFNYEQFVDVLLNSDDLPVFFFQVEVIDTNMTFPVGATGVGSTSIIADNNPLLTQLEINGFAFFTTLPQSVDFLNFPTGWEPGHIIEQLLPSDQVPFVLTEITQVPLPAALPLFGLSLLLLARRKSVLK